MFVRKRLMALGAAGYAGCHISPFAPWLCWVPILSVTKTAEACKAATTSSECMPQSYYWPLQATEVSQLLLLLYKLSYSSFSRRRVVFEVYSWDLKSRRHCLPSPSVIFCSVEMKAYLMRCALFLGFMPPPPWVSCPMPGASGIYILFLSVVPRSEQVKIEVEGRVLRISGERRWRGEVALLGEHHWQVLEVVQVTCRHWHGRHLGTPRGRLAEGWRWRLQARGGEASHGCGRLWAFHGPDILGDLAKDPDIRGGKLASVRAQGHQPNQAELFNEHWFFRRW